ncbi:SpoIIE family protein phosphatase [Streptomyces sp. NPDC004376]
MEKAVPGEGDEESKSESKGPRLWRQVVTQLSTALIVMDSAGRIIEANPAAGKLVGHDPAAMVGQDAHDLLHRDTDGNRVSRGRCPLLKVLTDGVAARGEGDAYVRKDGQLVAVSWVASPLTEGVAGKGLAVLVTDASVDLGARKERAAYTRALEDLAERLTLVAEITDVLAQTLETDEALARLGHLLVPRLADWAVVDLRVGAGQIQRAAVTGPEGRYAAHERRGERFPESGDSANSPLLQVLNGGDPVLQDLPATGASSDSPLAVFHDSFLEAVNATTAITVPLGAKGRITGALTLVRTDRVHPFDAEDLRVVTDLGRRVGMAIDNARRFGRQRAIAEAMQENLLTFVPQRGRIKLAARYQPAPVGSHVGGDWYDAFSLKDGTTALVIGDVVGHDLTAAAGMAQLRGILRSLAWDHIGPPDVIIDHLDDAMPAITTVPMATLVLARILGNPCTGPWALQWANAGHPPPLLLTPDGEAKYLEAGSGLLLGTGLREGGKRTCATQPLPAGSTLLLYTDGLIEIPGSDLANGLNRLRRHARALVREPLEILCDRLLTHMPPGGTDDVALLALRLPAPEGP